MFAAHCECLQQQQVPDVFTKQWLVWCRYNDMVGHSQLDSDMLQASPHLPAADDGYQVTEAEADSSAEEQEEDNQARGSDDVDDDDGGDEVEEGDVAVPSADAALPLPEPGHRRKRSKLHHRHVQEELLVRSALCSSPCAQHLTCSSC